MDVTGSTGTPMNDRLRGDLVWWKHLVFENEFAGVPMSMFHTTPPESDCWVVIHDESSIIIEGLTPQRTFSVTGLQSINGTSLAESLLRVVTSWIPVNPTPSRWQHIRVYVQTTWEVKLLQSMYCLDPVGQRYLRELALAQACRRLSFTVTRVLGPRSETCPCDVHTPTYQCDRVCVQTDLIELQQRQLKRAAINESSLRAYTKKFNHWVSFCEEFGFPIWVDELPQERQARIVGLFAGLCALEGHNNQKRGNKYQTFDSKMAAVAFAHRSVRNARLNYNNPEFELIAQGHKRTNSHVDRNSLLPLPCCAKCTVNYKKADPTRTTGRPTSCGDR